MMPGISRRGHERCHDAASPRLVTSRHESVRRAITTACHAFIAELSSDADSTISRAELVIGRMRPDQFARPRMASCRHVEDLFITVLRGRRRVYATIAVESHHGILFHYDYLEEIYQNMR